MSAVRTRPKEFFVHVAACYRMCQLCRHGIVKGEECVNGHNLIATTICMDCARLIAEALT